MGIKIIRKGVSPTSGKHFLVIEVSGDTKARAIASKFARNWSPGIGGTNMKETRNGINYYTEVFWKREKPLTDKELKELLQDGYKCSFYV